MASSLYVANPNKFCVIEFYIDYVFEFFYSENRLPVHFFVTNAEHDMVEFRNVYIFSHEINAILG